MKLKIILNTLSFLIVDFIIFMFVLLIVSTGQNDSIELIEILPIMLLSSLGKIVIFYFENIYKIIVRHFAIAEALKISLISVITNIFVVLFLWNHLHLNALVIMFIFIGELFFLISTRLTRRLLSTYFSNRKTDNQSDLRTLVIGAGAAGKLMIDELRTNKLLHSKPVVVVDDDQSKQHRLFQNLKVEGPISNVSSFVKAYNIQQVVIAIGNISRKKLFEILNYLKNDQVMIKRLPLLEEIKDKGVDLKIQDVDIHELLGRDVIPLANDQIEAFIKDKVVLITGGGGSIGSELARQVFSYQPKLLILLDIYENTVYDIQQELVRRNQKLENKVDVQVLIGSTYDLTTMEAVFQSRKPNIVFHAAAYKHVPLMEDAPHEAVRSNILGTYNIAKLSTQYGIQKMVLVSTDKAVRPTNVMGATKYYAEAIIRHFSKMDGKTSFSAVRFGNVLGSNGSVIPLFRKQIANGGPITVTDKNITRYFMTIPEAVGLILQSGVYASGGEIFVLDMGQPIKIVDLAEKMIRQAGLTPYEDIHIAFTGLRPGEKLYEELLLDVNNNVKTANEKIFIERTVKLDFDLEKYNTIVKMAVDHDPKIVKALFSLILQPLQ
jgi:FlaA1/EpsC-like NDP-sugar epimerase